MADSSDLASTQVLFEQVGPLAPPAGGRETSNPAIKVRDLSTMNQAWT